MRNIKKAVKTTIATGYKMDNSVPPVLQPCGTVEFFGGLGERLAKSRAAKKLNADFVTVENVKHTYFMDAETFLKYAVLDDSLNEEENEEENED